jgi:hypothetical protein
MSFYTSGSYGKTPSGFDIRGPKALPKRGRLDEINTDGPIVKTVSTTGSIDYSAYTGSYSTWGQSTRAVYVGNGGNIELRMTDSSSNTFYNVDDGTMLPVRATQWSGSVSNVLFLY